MTRYRIEERIAEGGFAAIYRATDLVTGAPIALKVLHAHLAADAAIVERFAREAALLRELQSAQAVTMYGSGVTDGGAPYLAMELLAGESLHARMLATGRLPWREAVAIARGVCGALAEPHALGIVHRDVKPANVFLEAGGRVRVLDFGIAKHIELGHLDADLTRQGELVGTLDYMAPEQLVGGGASPQADIFALGVVLYEMLSGARPFADAAGTLGQLAALLGSEPTPLPDDVGAPAALARVIARCLHREPETRFPTVGQLDAALAAVLEADLADADTVASLASLGSADTLAARLSDDDLETEDTWIGEVPLPPITPPPAARVRFATGTSEDGAPYAHGTQHTEPQLFARGSAPPRTLPMPEAPAMCASAPLPAMRGVTTPSMPCGSMRVKLTLGVAALLVGAATAYLALAM